jgi:hypothetical protein
MAKLVDDVQIQELVRAAAQMRQAEDLGTARII